MPNKNLWPQRLLVWVPVVLWMGAIFMASSLPADEVPALFRFQDVIFHVIVYVVLGYLCARALCRRWSHGGWKAAVVTGIVCVVYGITDEFHQAFVPGRSVSALDVMYDGIGGFLGGYLFSVMKRNRR